MLSCGAVKMFRDCELTLRCRDIILLVERDEKEIERKWKRSEGCFMKSDAENRFIVVRRGVMANQLV